MLYRRTYQELILCPFDLFRSESESLIGGVGSCSRGLGEREATGGSTDGVADPKLPFEVEGRGGECFVGEIPVLLDGKPEVWPCPFCWIGAEGSVVEVELCCGEVFGGTDPGTKPVLPSGSDKLDPEFVYLAGARMGVAARGEGRLIELRRCPSMAGVELRPFGIYDCGSPNFAASADEDELWIGVD